MVHAVALSGEVRHHIGMKKVFLAALIGLFMLGVGGSVYVYADDDVSFSQIVELFISLGIIPEEKAENARNAVAGLTGEEVVAPEPEGSMNKEHVEITVSQYIENASLEYAAGEDIVGLILVAKNTHTEPVVLEAKRGCQVVYRVRDRDDTVLYDSRDSEKCQTEEEVTYLLEAGQPRVFGVEHKQSDYALTPGTYVIEMEYPGYGSGTKTVRIIE